MANAVKPAYRSASIILFLAAPKLRELLAIVYDVAERTVILAETLHAIIAHRSDGRPLTLEAGIVRVADALDMAKGRSRIMFAAGKINIHSLSAAAIDRIEIQTGEIKPIRIAIAMLNSAGVFQLPLPPLETSPLASLSPMGRV
jgi:metal-dependent HD superfamily phosphatase/phosphodiesterase